MYDLLLSGKWIRSTIDPDYMDTHLKIATILTILLETRFRIGKFRFGFDAFIGLAPFVGDIIMTIFSFYLIWIGVKMKLPTEKILVMLKNIFIDFMIGLFPLVGDLADVIYKANTKNLRILKEHKKEPSIIEGEIISE